MEWARARKGDGSVVTGIVEGGALHPRAALGAEQGAGDPVALAEVTLLAPVVPGKFIGLWNNFHAAAEKNGWAQPAHPLYFLKPVTSLAGPGDTVAIPPDIGRVLFEGELGVVIGAECRNVPADEAGAAILGYTCVNDFTALNILTEDPSFPQWTRAKGFDGFGVIGPGIVTGLDWRALEVKVTVNGRERQSYACSDMIFGPEEIVARLSKDMTLMPGDVIACGTSLGAMPVKPGQEVEVRIEGIGGVAVRMA
ncbi:fumarylacetoacetate hydrolase family protein [Maliponia aquimaris]|uniref:Ureidoglycolate lyase n=1 Tax=Maliponia aquimaris TaxID=1673631 RepID=A0A238K1H4_9RHOB|nr:fumarylacetoacetate hydrolase family protein [Maliponia aquimaris]SMX36735.1 Ureidoglycolate lyase [Maliponia aquimaris]